LLPRKWKQVDLGEQTIRLEPGTTENGEGREFPYGDFPMPKEAIDKQRERKAALEKASILCPHVFNRGGQPMGDFRGAWERACSKAGVPGRIPHDFRRTAV
jgi:integrase